MPAYNLLRYFADEYIVAWRRALARAGEGARAIEKICALVDADFETALCMRKKISVWFAFWGKVNRIQPIKQFVAKGIWCAVD